MKKLYENPEMIIATFENSNIVTASGDGVESGKAYLSDKGYTADVLSLSDLTFNF